MGSVLYRRSHHSVVTHLDAVPWWVAPRTVSAAERDPCWRCLLVSKCNVKVLANCLKTYPVGFIWKTHNIQVFVMPKIDASLFVPCYTLVCSWTALVPDFWNGVKLKSLIEHEWPDEGFFGSRVVEKEIPRKLSFPTPKLRAGKNVVVCTRRRTPTENLISQLCWLVKTIAVVIILKHSQKKSTLPGVWNR